MIDKTYKLYQLLFMRLLKYKKMMANTQKWHIIPRWLSYSCGRLEYGISCYAKLEAFT
jgi:hypothetical protein